MKDGLAHAEDGSLCQTVGFDYERVAQSLGEAEPSSHDIDAAIVAFKSLLRWVWQAGPREEELLGIKIRLIIAAWIFLEELQADSLSKTARDYKLDKQSLGRWIDDKNNDQCWKAQFPHIKTPHMRE